MISLAGLARITGSISILGSFCAGIHQFYLGYIYEGADGFSPALLMGWLMGDVCNIIGTFWTHQLTFQKVIACASALNDIMLAGQHIYYKRKHRRYVARHINPEPVAVGNDRYLAMKWNSLLRPYILFTLVSASRAAPVRAWSKDGSLVLDPDGDDIDLVFLIGQCMAWVAELSYAFALVPQVLENFTRKSTGSVSITMFIADAISSFNYLATILITADGKPTHHALIEFLLEELPYIFGTATCLLLDLILLFQYFLYPQFVVHLSTIDASMPTDGLILTEESTPIQPFRSWKSIRSYDSTDESRRV